MEVNGAAPGETLENEGSPTELSLREEIEKNLADLKGESQDPAPTAPETPAAPAPAEPAEKTPAADPEQPENAIPETPKSKAPQSWSAADRAHWDKIPAEVQAVIARREEEAHKGITQLGQDAAFGKKINEVVSPYLPMIRAEGGNAVGAVQDLLQTAYVLRTANPEQKVGIFRQLATQFGVDLAAAAQAAPQVDPQVQALQRELAQVRGHLQRGEQQQHQQVQDQAQSMIDAFAADPKNEFYQQVAPLMGSLLVNGQASTMQEAYDMACHAIPDVRSTILTRQTAEAEAKRATEAKAKADAKRRAAGSINGSPGAPVTTTTAQPNLSLRDELRANLRAATAS
jgi:hypothetical protein